MSVLPPPLGVPYLDPVTNTLTEAWRRYYLSLSAAGAVIYAPPDAQYFVATSNSVLTNERNLAALASGYLKLTVAAGIATPSTVAAIPVAEIGAGTAAISISGNAATTTALQTARTINGVAFDGTINVTVPAAAATLTGTTLPALDGAALTNLTGANVAGGGVYTPTLTNTANITASTAFSCQYFRIGAIVHVTGQVNIQPTAGATLTRLEMSLPIASVLTATNECAGAAAAPAVAGYSAAIQGNATNGTAELRFTTGADVANRGWFFSYSYRVL
jgi:hypothetical protein